MCQPSQSCSKRTKSLATSQFCPVCLEQFYYQEKKLECNHFICKECLKKLLDKSIEKYDTAIIECPQCRSLTDFEIQSDNVLGRQALAKMKAFKQDHFIMTMPRISEDDEQSISKRGLSVGTIVSDQSSKNSDQSTSSDQSTQSTSWHNLPRRKSGVAHLQKYKIM